MFKVPYKLGSLLKSFLLLGGQCRNKKVFFQLRKYIFECQRIKIFFQIIPAKSGLVLILYLKIKGRRGLFPMPTLIIVS